MLEIPINNKREWAVTQPQQYGDIVIDTVDRYGEVEKTRIISTGEFILLIQDFEHWKETGKHMLNESDRQSFLEEEDRI